MQDTSTGFSPLLWDTFYIDRLRFGYGTLVVSRVAEEAGGPHFPNGIPNLLGPHFHGGSPKIL